MPLKRQQMANAKRRRKRGANVPLQPFAEKTTARYVQTPSEPRRSVAEGALATARCTTAT
jgi:hypothetical protein